MAKARSLKDITLAEVSLVDKAANKKKFLFFKQEKEQATDAKKKAKKLKKKINIVIDSDGTVGGTKIVLNKEELKDLRDFSFSFWGDSDMDRAVSASYSKFVENDDGFSRSETFYLSKGNVKMDAKIQEQLKEYFGEEEIDFEKASENEAIVKALKTINEYKEDFPDDLKSAVAEIAKQAGMYSPQKVEKKEEENKDEVKKAGAKLSKDSLKKITDALATLKSLLPALKEDAGNTEKSDVEKSISELTTTIEQLEKKNDKETEKETDSKLTKVLTDLTKRLETVEKGTGVKKSLDDQDNDDEEVNKTGEKRWPSFESKT